MLGSSVTFYKNNIYQFFHFKKLWTFYTIGNLVEY
jgi:hypothetical protein